MICIMFEVWRGHLHCIASAVWEVNIFISPSIAYCDYCLSPNLIICQHWLHLGGIGRIYVFSTTKVSKHIDTQLVDNLRHLICFKWRHFTQLIPLLSRTAQTVSCCYLLPHIIHTLVVAATYCLLSDTTCTWSYRAAALQTIHLMWQ